MNSTRDERPDDRPDELGHVDLACDNARSLVPGYLDGELTEAQAVPLRAHLFACPACRETAKDEANLKRWFSTAAVPAVDVPPGFAARVARRAFAGDPGLAVPVASSGGSLRGEGRANLLPFLLQLTAVAAVLLLVFAVAIQTRSLPAGDGLEAGDPPPWERQLAPPGVRSEATIHPDRAAEESGDEAAGDGAVLRPGSRR